MYIAKQTLRGVTEFTIRESYLDRGIYRHRDLMALGPDPSIYVHYPMGRSYYIDDAVTEKLCEALKSFDYDELESIFWPYINPAVKRRYEFARSKSQRVDSKTASPIVHPEFDKRRFIYLKAGNMNQKKIHAVQDKYFLALGGKSRDEIEQHFILMESELTASELKNYIYVIFDLQRHFSAMFAREMPEAMDQEKIAHYFIDDLCRINRDRSLWLGMETGSFLNDYLKRYVIMFFDYDFEKSSFWEDREFEKFNRRRYHRQHTRPVEEVYSEAGTIFDIPERELKKMTKRQLKKLFRKKAQELHPDKGGEQDDFVNLSRVYDELILRKN